MNGVTLKDREGQAGLTDSTLGRSTSMAFCCLKNTLPITLPKRKGKDLDGQNCRVGGGLD